MEKKITKKENLMNIKEVLVNSVVNNLITNEEYQRYEKFINHEIELLDKKAKNRGTGATQEENEKIAKLVLNILGNTSEPLTITDILEYEEIASYITLAKKKISNQKLSAIMTQLKNSNIVVNIKDKKKSMFKLA